MNYWMTTHWPPSEVTDLRGFEPEGIWLPDDRMQAGTDLKEGDKVLIYQSKTRRREYGKRRVSHEPQGREGIIAVVRVVGPFLEAVSEPTKYVSGPPIWWRWHAATEIISIDGFVPRTNVNEVLGYKLGNPMRGFGDRKSGLKKLTPREFQTLASLFRQNASNVGAVQSARRNNRWIPHDQRGESQAHRSLKDYVASDPSRILGEDGLRTIRKEYPFQSGDKADIVLEDSAGSVIGAEVELSVDDTQLAGVLQAIKYRYMLALAERRDNRDTRSFLIAHSISPSVALLCGQYEVECFEVTRLR